MKKTLLLLIAIPFIGFSQETTTTSPSVSNENTLSLNFQASDPLVYGLSFEHQIKPKDEHSKSMLVNIGYAATVLEKNKIDLVGTGFQIDLGERTYLGKNKLQGWFYQNFLSHGQVKFSEYGFNGKYSYWSIINPDLGYKFVFAKSFVLEANAGFNWKWEVNTKTDLDNKDFSNFVPKLGVKLGYKF